MTLHMYTVEPHLTDTADTHDITDNFESADHFSADFNTLKTTEAEKCTFSLPHAENLTPHVEKRVENLAPHAEKFAPHEIFWVMSRWYHHYNRTLLDAKAFHHNFIT